MSHDDEPVLLPFRRPPPTAAGATDRRGGAWAGDPEMERLTRWLAHTPDWPDRPFDLIAPGGDAVFCIRVLDPGRYRAALLADAARGPGGANAAARKRANGWWSPRTGSRRCRTPCRLAAG